MKRIGIIWAMALGIVIGWACGNVMRDARADGGGDSQSGSRIEVRPVVYTGEDGSTIRAGEELYDTELDTACEPGVAADGVVRCLPKPETVPSRNALTFEDSECSQATFAYFVPVGACSPRFALLPSESCDATRTPGTRAARVRTLEAVYILSLDDHSCTLYDPETTPGRVLVALDEIEPAQMVALSRQQ